MGPTTSHSGYGALGATNLQITFSRFDADLRLRMLDPFWRPFVCDGSPLESRIFIVGFNAATVMAQPFWHYWSSSFGFDKSLFMSDYLVQRTRLKGARLRIEEIVNQLPRGLCLETNIYSPPTKKAADLKVKLRRTDMFEFLFSALRPALVYVHSNKPIEFFKDISGCQAEESKAQTAVWRGHQFQLIGTPGPLWRMSRARAAEIGKLLGATLGHPVASL